MVADPRDDRQVERALKWILAIAIAGIVVIAVLALGRPKNLQTPFFGIATLSAFTALAAGAALGLLFGLPWRTDHVAVAPQTPAAGGAASAAPVTAAPAPAEGWYKDNTSLEQIAQWLTTSIVALTLVNFDGWVRRFESAATAVTCGMYDRLAPAPALPPGAPPTLAQVQCGLAPGGIILAMYA